ncbi:hypothetical protein B0H14DRAFT_2363791, partial [Mycena olivaceomarginata]
MVRRPQKGYTVFFWALESNLARDRDVTSRLHNTCWFLLTPILGRALKFRPAIFSYVAKDESLRAHELSTADWTALKLVSKWLMAFRDATTQMSTTKQPMISNTHAVFLGLEKHIKIKLANLPQETDPVLRQGLVDAHTKLSDYFTKFDRSRYY